MPFLSQEKCAAAIALADCGLLAETVIRDCINVGLGTVGGKLTPNLRALALEEIAKAEEEADLARQQLGLPEGSCNGRLQEKIDRLDSIIPRDF